ncbi:MULTISPECIES: histidine phosphatase family protein [Halocynthiibacter]|uniref:histidine phosphatase family protein n=1 Tax=Halocynthiibacter TaxID=1579315 RepID=UPI002938D73D|nr:MULTISPECIES: histidine phosphatase family protein [Halocynthiibacter]
MNDIKRLWWVRHAPTHAKTMVGWTDLPADLSNSAQIKRVSDALPETAPIITSPLSRAVETGKAIANARHTLQPDPDLREIHFGKWENRTFDDVNAESEDALRAFWDTPGDTRPPGGESWNALRTRVDSAADRLLRRPETDIIIVAHFGAILCQVQRALGQDTPTVFAQKIDNLSVTCLEYQGTWCAKHINKLF